MGTYNVSINPLQYNTKSTCPGGSGMRRVVVVLLSCFLGGLLCVARFRRVVAVSAGLVICVLAALYWIGVSAPPPEPESSHQSAPDTLASRTLKVPSTIQSALSRPPHTV